MSVLINAYCTHRSPPPLDFPHQLNSRRDTSDPELADHLNGFIGYIMQNGDREMTQSLYHVYRHIQRVQHHLSFDVEEEALDAFSAWAWKANAIVFLPDGSVRDPSGKTLVSVDDGSCDDEACVPYPQDAIDRKRKHDELLRQHGIPVYEHLPPVVGECELQLRTPAEVARRALALFAVALRAESLASNNAIPPAEIRARIPLAFESLSPVEAEFMQTEVPEQQAIIDHAWRYECLFVLQWALGHFDKLHFPAKICDVPAVARDILDREGTELIRQAQLRPARKILNALDLHFRLHWAARNAQQQAAPPPNDLDMGVIQERRHALNWLTHFEDADWDDVDCPT